jgi:Prokaryotic STING domain
LYGADSGKLAFDIAHDRYVDVDLDAQAGEHPLLVKMLDSVLKEKPDPSKAPLDPVTTYFKVPLADAYPASGLAKGYCENFVVRTARSVATAKQKRLPIRIKVPDRKKEAKHAAEAAKWRASLPLTDEEWRRIEWCDETLQLTKDEWDKITLTIWIPDKLKFVKPEHSGVLKRTGEFYDATIFDPEKNFRDISALVRRDTLQVIDIPTTLLAISTSVDGYSQSKTVEGQAHLDREFARIRRVFEYWKSVSADREEENSQSDKAYIKFLWEKVVIDTLPPKYTDV